MMKDQKRKKGNDMNETCINSNLKFDYFNEKNCYF